MGNLMITILRVLYSVNGSQGVAIFPDADGVKVMLSVYERAEGENGTEQTAEDAKFAKANAGKTPDEILAAAIEFYANEIFAR